MGPLVHIRLGKDPRMDLVIPRGSAEFEALYKDRTSTERYNSTVKSKGRMAQGAYRRKHFVFTIAVLHAIEKHAMAWVDLVFARQRPRTAAELLEWLSRQQQSVAPEPLTQRPTPGGTGEVCPEGAPAGHKTGQGSPEAAQEPGRA